MAHIEYSSFRIGFHLWGSLTGSKTVFYFHGFPGSHYEPRIFHELAEQKNIKIVAIDRPGYGLSSSAYGTDLTLNCWPSIVEQIADLLVIEQFLVCGLSGGAPYALSVASGSSRVAGAVIVSGMSWLESSNDPLLRFFTSPARVTLKLGLKFPELMPELVSLCSKWIQFRPQDLIRAFKLSLADCDKKVLKNPQVVEELSRSFRTGLKQGRHGVRQDFRNFTRPWGIDVSQIADMVVFIHGDEDYLVPEEMARRSADAIKNSRLILVPGSGHFLAFEQQELIFDTICEQAGQ